MNYISSLKRTRAYPLDKETELRDISAAALSATASETAIALAVDQQCSIRIVLDHAAIASVVAGTAEWKVAFEISPDNSTWVKVRSWTLGADKMTYESVVSGPEMTQLVASATHGRVTATKTGTPGNLSYGAFLTID